MKFLAHRIADRRLLRLLKKWLRAGVSEDGEWSPTTIGTPQGAVISPLFANVFLHYVLDLWINDWRKRQAKGEVTIVRYADDFVIGFREESDARRCLADLKERLAKFGLELHPEKTRLIEFGRYAKERRTKRNETLARRRLSTFWALRISAARPGEAISRSTAKRRGRNSRPNLPT
jgi:retron-type reverse transcriptase